MTAARRVSAGGSYRIDRRFGSIGRISMASGATNLKTFKKLDALLTRLWENGYLDVLAAIKDRRVTLQEVYQAEQAGRLRYVATDLVLYRPLWETVDAWLPMSARSEGSRIRYGVSMRALKRVSGLGADTLVKDLADVDWELLRRSWTRSPAHWNRVRAAVSRFLTIQLGSKYHAFRLDLIGRIPHAREPRGRVPDLTPAVFWRIMEACPEHVRATYVTLAGTGLRVGEYLALEGHHLRPHTKTLAVPGTKTEASEDVIHIGPELWDWLVAAVPPPHAYAWTYKLFKRAARGAGVPDLTLHDLRHLKGQILSEAGLPMSKIATALRHSSTSTTERYTRQRDHGEAAEATDRALFFKQGDGTQ